MHIPKGQSTSIKTYTLQIDTPLQAMMFISLASFTKVAFKAERTVIMLRTKPFKEVPQLWPCTSI